MLPRDAVLQTPIVDSPPARTLPLGTWMRHRVHVEALERVVADLAEVASVQQVEHAQVQEERVVGLPDPAPTLAPAPGVDHRSVEQVGVVVRHRRVTDVARCHRRVVQEPGAVATLDLPQVVRLADQQVLVVQGGHRAVVVDERVGVAVLGLEAPPVGDVRTCIPVVVDVDVVVRLLGPEVEVRAAGRLLEGDPRADQRDRVGLVRADERIDIGVVDLRIRRRERRLPVARCDDRRRGEPREQSHTERERRCAGDGPLPDASLQSELLS